MEMTQGAGITMVAFRSSACNPSDAGYAMSTPDSLLYMTRSPGSQDKTSRADFAGIVPDASTRAML